MNKLQRLKSAGKVIRPPDIVEWRPATSTEPVYESMTQGQYFWNNLDGVGLRNAYHHSPTQYSIPTSGGQKRYRFSVNPSSTGEFHHRAEVTRDWVSGMPLATRDGLGFGLEAPIGGLKPRDHDIDFNQWHTGTAPGGPYEANSPCVRLLLSRAGTEDDNDDVAELNEVVVVNSVRRKEQEANPQISGRINTGIIVNNGERHEFEVELISGINGTGHFLVWHCEQISTNLFTPWELIYSATESTAWANDADGGSNSNVHPDWKLGIYAPGVRDLSGVLAAEALNGGAPGSYSITLDYVGIRSLYLPTSHSFYTKNVFGFLQTTNMQ